MKKSTPYFLLIPALIFTVFVLVYPLFQNLINSPDLKNFRASGVYKHELDHARTWPAHPKIIAIVRNVIAPYGQKGIIGELTPQEAMDQAAEEAQAMIDGKE